MKNYKSKITLALAFLLTVIFAASPVLAERRPWKDNYYRGRDHRHKGYQHPAKSRHQFFNDRHRVVTHKHYVKKHRRGHCPPGLAKRGRHCAPRNHAKRWVIGRPLPRDVVFYDLTPRVIADPEPAPSHHKFVRVAQDILLLANGTGMVVDAIDNLDWELGH